jgi:hypothetical protein
MESDFNADLNVDRFPVFHGWLETPLANGIQSFGIQSIAETADDPNVPWTSTRIDDQPENARALGFCAACLLGILRIRRRDSLRSRDAAAHMVNTPTDTAAAAGAHTRAMAYTDTASRTRTDTAARSSSI